MPGCERKNVTICNTSFKELSKCLDMQKVAYTRRIRPDVRCIQPLSTSTVTTGLVSGFDSVAATVGKEACIEEIKNRRADIMSLDASDLYSASRWVDCQLPCQEFRDALFFVMTIYDTNQPWFQLQTIAVSKWQSVRCCRISFGWIMIDDTSRRPSSESHLIEYNWNPSAAAAEWYPLSDPFFDSWTSSYWIN